MTEFTIQDIDDGLLDPIALPPPTDITKLEQQLKVSWNSALWRLVRRSCSGSICYETQYINYGVQSVDLAVVHFCFQFPHWEPVRILTTLL